MFPACSSQRSLRRALLVCCALGAMLLAGCGDDGPKTYQLTGAVTYQGQPVPRGYIIFEPNKAAGNAGPGAQIEIQDGRYQTLSGNGVIGGPHLVHVHGFDGVPVTISTTAEGEAFTSPLGTPLFTNYVFELDLPRESTEQDLDVPAQ